MTDNDILLSHARELKIKAEDNSMITSTNFLTDEQISLLSVLEKVNNKYVDTFYYGGYEQAQRRMAVFVPRFYEVENIADFFYENSDDNPLCVLQLTKDRFSSLSHRDYLGSVMGLGIEREMVGDIITNEDGAYLFCVKKMEKYLCEYLKKAGRGTIECRRSNLSELKFTEDNYVEIFSSVASLRLDNMISAAFAVSRSSAVQFINQGVVYVNNTQCEKADFIVKQGDKLVLRGKGKAVFDSIKGETRKGRVHVIFKRYK